MSINQDGWIATKCPYYQREYQRSIDCEGIYEGIENSYKFKTEKEKNQFQKDFCYCYPNLCANAKSLDEIYRLGNGKE